MPMIALALLKGWISTALAIWRGLPGPVKAALLIAAAGLAGVLWGEHDGNRRCEARIAASIERAKAFDQSAAAKAHTQAQQQAHDADVRAATVRDEVKGYVQELAKRTVAGCQSGADADRYNDGLGVQDDGVQHRGPQPAPGGRRGAEPGAVPQGTGK